MNLSEFDHGSWYAIGGVAVGYTVLLAIIFVALFIIPYAVFVAL